MVKAELVYISEQELVHLSLCLKEGATVFDALQQAQIEHNYPEIKELAVGIFSKKVTLDTKLLSGDRIEIYRPLKVDPKERRRQRVKPV